MQIPELYRRNGLGRFIGVSGTYIGMLNLTPDALVDGYPAWSKETAMRLKAEREARLREQLERRLAGSSGD